MLSQMMFSGKYLHEVRLHLQYDHSISMSAVQDEMAIVFEISKPVTIHPSKSRTTVRSSLRNPAAKVVCRHIIP